MGALIFGIIAVAFAIWAMVAVVNSRMNKTKKIAWFAVVVLIPVIGPLLYYFLGK